ncbi:MAG: hypothetical protein RL417_736 [Pseudomonadota bacterium]|jgi:hypothetical protein
MQLALLASKRRRKMVLRGDLPSLEVISNLTPTLQIGREDRSD